MRLDLLLVARGLARSRSQAQDLIRRGQVQIAGKNAEKSGIDVPPDALIQVREDTSFVARSWQKLAAALDEFALSPKGRVCLDVGACTGGFTQVLLERGAERIYAVDTGRDQLAADLRADPRVTLMEGTDARALRPSMFARPMEAFTVDVSFISVLKVLPALWPLAALSAWGVILIKPQFEVGRAHIGKGGIVKDEAAKQAAVERVADAVSAAGWRVLGAMKSPIKGQSGNEEILLAALRQS